MSILDEIVGDLPAPTPQQGAALPAEDLAAVQAQTDALTAIPSGVYFKVQNENETGIRYAFSFYVMPRNVSCFYFTTHDAGYLVVGWSPTNRKWYFLRPSIQGGVGIVPGAFVTRREVVQNAGEVETNKLLRAPITILEWLAKQQDVNAAIAEVNESCSSNEHLRRATKGRVYAQVP